MLAVDNSITSFVGDAVTLVFETTFPYYDKSTIIVSKGVLGTETVLVEGVDYTIDAVGIPTGEVTLTVPAGVGNILLISRVLPIVQQYDPTSNFNPTSLMTALDKIVMMIQQINDGSISAAYIHGNLAGGAYHAVASAVANGFMAAADWSALYNHIADVGNPHAVTAIQAGAAPDTHVGSRDLALGHPAVTTTEYGFMIPADKLKLDGIPTNVDPRNVMLFDDFLGPALDTSRWTRTPTAVNPVASVTADAFGVYQELTDAGSATSAVLLRSTAKGPTSLNDPEFEARLVLGASGGLVSNVQYYLGLAKDPALRTVSCAMFHMDGTTAWCKSSDGAGVFQSTSISYPAASAFKRWKILVTSANVKFYVDNVLVATHSTRVPAIADAMEPFFYTVNISANARSIGIDFAYLSATRP